MGFQNGWRGPDIVADGLVLYLDAGSPNSYRPDFGTTWKDMSGNGYNGALTNGPTFSNNSIVFDGTNDYIQGNNSLSSKITTAITISIFAKVPSMSNRVPLFGKYQTISPKGYALEVGTVSGFWTKTIRFYAEGDNFNTSDYRGNVQLSDNTVYMFTAQYSAAQSIMKMYYNTTEMTATQANANWANVANWGAGTNEYYIGAFQPSINVYGNSTIYNTLVYNRILSLNEITQNYNAQKSRFGL